MSAIHPFHTKALGCTDCGEVWKLRSLVAKECRPFTVWVRRDETAIGGWSESCDDPIWDDNGEAY